MIKAVVFDLDGTLLDRGASLVRFAQRQYWQRGALRAVVTEEGYVRSLVELDDDGHVWKDEVYRQLIERYGIEGVTWQDLLQEYVDDFASACIGFPGMQEVVGRLKAEGYLLGIVTNGSSPFQEGNIRALGIQSFFSTILVSGAVGLRKPDAAIFEAVLRRLGVQASETVFIGDSPDADIKGAKSAGMKTIWKYSDRHQTCSMADAICYDLMTLPKTIRGL